MKLFLQTNFCVVLYLSIVTAAFCFDASPFCAGGQHVEIDGSARSPNKALNAVQQAICDIPPALSDGWYRFTGVADDRLTSQPVPEYRCGTVQPVWTNDTFPTTGKGKMMTVCLEQNNRSCGLSGILYVQNCGSFYIYYPKSMPSCPRAYCVGPMASSSATSTTPRSTTTTETLPTGPL